MATRTTVPSRSARLHTAPQRPRKKRILFWALWLTVPVIAVLFGVVIGTVYAFAKLPVTNQAPPAQSIVFSDSSGKTIIGTVSPIANRHVVDYKDIPPVMRNAVLAAEDRDFYNHGALSYKGLVRAAWANVVQRRVAEGGSTITQQYVKNVFPAVGNERTIFRKVKEAVIAIKLEHHYTKDQILGSYLNAVYFGHGAYGVDAAAHAFFNTSVGKLSPAQAATLAGAIRAPEVYTRKANANVARERRNFILDVMAQRGWLSPDATAKAKAAPLKEIWVVHASGIANSKAPFFLELVRQYLVDQFGAAAVAQGGFRVRTTLDLKMQAQAEAAVKGILNHKGDPPASLVALDPRTGAVRALYAGATASQWATHPFNYATDSGRQAGSTFKPFVLEQALLDGVTLDQPLPAPDKVLIPNGTGKPGDVTTIRNFAGEHFSGNIPLLQATEQSVNTAYTVLLDKLARDGQSGSDRVATLAHRTGLDATLNSAEHKPNLAHVASLALGPSDVTTLQLASAFGTWANQGVHQEPYLVEWIKDSKGHLVKLPPHRSETVLDKTTANTMTYALRNVVEHGTGTAARLPDRQVAGKTGTTNDSKDARFVGYTTDLVTSVWMGYTTPRPMVNLHGVANVTGGTLPAEIWHNFMAAATQGTPGTAFPLPQQANALPAATATTAAPATTPPTTAVPTSAPPTTLPPSSAPSSTAPATSTFVTQTTKFRATTTTR
jgi:penicillin-binding protein 1A